MLIPEQRARRQSQLRGRVKHYQPSSLLDGYLLELATKKHDHIKEQIKALKNPMAGFSRTSKYFSQRRPIIASSSPLVGNENQTTTESQSKTRPFPIFNYEIDLRKPEKVRHVRSLSQQQLLEKDIDSIRMKVHNCEWRDMLQMVQTMQSFYPYQPFQENQRDLVHDARASRATVYSMRQQTNSKSEEQNQAQKSINKKQIKSLIQTNQKKHFLDRYRYSCQSETDRGAYFKRLVQIREEEKNQAKNEVNNYKIQQDKALQHFSSDEEEDDDATSTNRERHNLSKSTLMLSPVHDQKQFTLGISPILSSRGGLTTKTFGPTTVKLNDLQKIDLHYKKQLDNALVQSIITNGQVRSLIKIQRLENPKQNWLSSKPKIPSPSSKSPQSNKKKPPVETFSSILLETTCFNELHRAKIQRAIMKKIRKSLFKQQNGGEQQNTQHTVPPLLHQLQVIEKLQQKQNQKLKAYNIKLSDCFKAVISSKTKHVKDKASPLFSEEYYKSKYDLMIANSLSSARDFRDHSNQRLRDTKCYASSVRNSWCDQYSQTNQQL